MFGVVDNALPGDRAKEDNTVESSHAALEGPVAVTPSSPPSGTPPVSLLSLPGELIPEILIKTDGKSLRTCRLV